MTKLKSIVYIIAATLFIPGCSQILETVSLSQEEIDVKAMNLQEDFKINVTSLTLKNAKLANKEPYPRQIMLTGVGSEANVFDEAKFLEPKIPSILPTQNYRLGIGDKLSFHQLNEFAELTTILPTPKMKTDYLLGQGDILTFVQLSEGINIQLGHDDKEIKSLPSESILTTSGTVGADGNVILLGLGIMEASNKTLETLRSEARTILVRNGLTPNFQLEITGFNSKKAFVTSQNYEKVSGKNVISITNIPFTLKDVVLSYGLQSSNLESLTITLTRDNQKFRMTARQLIDKISGKIVIQDRDQIDIFQTKSTVEPTQVIIGSNGNILIPDIGSIKASDRLLDEVQEDIKQILMDRGMVPNFQLEITEFNSKKFFLVTNNQSTSVKIMDYKSNLKEAILNNANDLIDGNEFNVVNLIRDGSKYQMTFEEMINGIGSKVQVIDGDTVELKSFKYKPGQVFALSGAGNAELISINPSKRETLADILFTPKGALNNLMAKRSEVYLIRGQGPLMAYHLDTQNVSRILVAAKMELRPNDIVFVADRPIVSFSRALADILPLRILLRDIKNNNIP